MVQRGTLISPRLSSHSTTNQAARRRTHTMTHVATMTTFDFFDGDKLEYQLRTAQLETAPERANWQSD